MERVMIKRRVDKDGDINTNVPVPAAAVMRSHSLSVPVPRRDALVSHGLMRMGSRRRMRECMRRCADEGTAVWGRGWWELGM